MVVTANGKALFSLVNLTANLIVQMLNKIHPGTSLVANESGKQKLDIRL